MNPFCNKAYCEQIGRSPEEIIGHKVWEFRPSVEERQQLKELHFQLLRDLPTPYPLFMVDLISTP